MSQSATATLPADELITSSTSAQLLSRPESTFRQWVTRGRILPAMVTPTGLKLFRRSEIEQFRQQLPERNGRG